MKCISVRQPWANMIANGEKTIETRTWATTYTGPLAIASSKRPKIWPAGCVVAVAYLEGCWIMTEYDEEAACCEIYPGAKAWYLKDIRKTKPAPVKGMLGIFEIDDELIEYER